MNNELRPRDYEEVSELLRLAHHCLLRARFILHRAGHEKAHDLKKINTVLWRCRKRIETEAAEQFCTLDELRQVHRRHTWSPSAAINLFLKY